METKDKRVKREIANSNERRRMQSINAGFQKLKRLLPINDGEKLSKANILQHASEFIQHLHEQNTLLRGILMEVKSGADLNTALDSIDLDALQTIPSNTHIVMNSSNNAHNNSNDTTITDSNSNDCCIRSTTKNGANNNNHKKVTNKNNGNNESCDLSAPDTKANIIINDKKCDYTNQPSMMSGVAEITSDRITTSPKAAIALPLEVPYTSETAIIVDTQDPAPKGQNLDTICKAIMEIEGDRVFKNE